LATQNPVEQEGTFPLPEAQLDRFFLRLVLGYPQREQERQILHRFRTANPLVELLPVANAEDIRQASRICRQVYLHPDLEDYLLDLVAATRNHPAIALGVSPRGTLAIYRASQALAALRGRSYVQPDDIKALLIPALAHRLVPSVDARLHERSMNSVLEQILAQTPLPVEEVWEPR
jgi:MoxR-like ATPase